MLTETLHTQLAEIASIEAITHETPTVDGKQPALGVAPRSLSELAAVVTELHQAESATILVGGGTMLDLGKPPTAAEVALCTGSLNLITEYQPADLIVTAQAGVTLANLQETLREHDQTLPLQVPCPDRATVGGAVAANTHGPLRYTFGTAKDLVMGMQFVQGDGTLVKSGGEVVKNVAGFGLHKLHVGALGTLGVIATATFKVYPLPKADQTLLFAFEDANAAFAAAYAIRAHHPASAAVINEAIQRASLARPTVPMYSSRAFWVRSARLSGKCATPRRREQIQAQSTQKQLLKRMAGPCGSSVWTWDGRLPRRTFCSRRAPCLQR